MQIPTLSSDTAIARMMAWVVLAVGAIGAVESYRHIEHLAAVHGADSVNAHLLPLAVDGLVAAAGLASLRNLRSDDRDWLPACSLAAGILATLAANLADGWQYGWIGRASFSWPAVAFVLCAELLLRSARRERKAKAKRAAVAASQKPAGRHGGRGAQSPAAKADRPVLDRKTAAAAILRERPDLNGPELAALLSTSPRTARRDLAGLRADPMFTPEPIASTNGHRGL